MVTECPAVPWILAKEPEGKTSPTKGPETVQVMETFSQDEPQAHRGCCSYGGKPGQATSHTSRGTCQYGPSGLECADKGEWEQEASTKAPESH